MTFDSGDKQADGDSAPGKVAYEVGYGKPPAAHRFRKGQSGNPQGRPRKAKAFEDQGANGLGTQPASKYLLEEAYRPVTVREGDQVIQLPAIQAIFRAMGVSAMKGNRYAQRTVAELVRNVEAEHRQSRLEHLEASINYKCNWEERIERARELGQPEPTPIPHPDDIIIDFVRGEAFVCGPMTKENKVDWDRWLAYRDLLQTSVSLFAAEYAKARSAKRKADFLDMWKAAQKRYDKENDNMPRRYRRELKDRCWEDGASMAGQQREHEWPGEIP